MKATQLLRSQHRDAKKILVALEKGKSTSKATVEKLVTALGAHMVIEQEIFYPAVKAIKPDLVLESFEEHAGAQSMMERLLKTEPGDESFTARVTTLKELIQHHVDEEEEDLFPKVEKQMETAALNTLGAQMKSRFDEVEAKGFRPALDLAEEEQPMPAE
jgi:hemerythrin-like domain-containing protein